MPDTRRPAVVCLHSSAASSQQWRRLVADGGSAWQWHTPDLFGHGTRPGWPELMPSQLCVEANGVLAGLSLPREQGFHLVGHSYGGTVALQIALQQPRRVLSLTLYEPVAFGLLPALGPNEPEWAEIREVAATLGAALDRGDDLGAARGFCGYWQGRNIWRELDDTRRLRLAEAMPTVRRHFEALFNARWSDSLLGLLRMPVHLICGTATRASAQRVAQSLAGRLPNVRFDWLEGAGHLAPITDAARVNELILESLGAMQLGSMQRALAA
ncbi:pimeloyl-ACP methyl ester carboxylesterase [Pelomonas aquatica]|uniref:Pimeloyl-ACP methyl ester carboxylesterase n=1 Tax=Pelomonas aquatica TaxID=431058 RepID=A0ABU1Z5S7_9BURK|nr:alpha/beta hydrolase [Pelomonas aquatica]MDR7295974.1 pimeloyl-ACP methyl ester carboxylesterase [Pelomonas aquatica]